MRLTPLTCRLSSPNLRTSGNVERHYGARSLSVSSADALGGVRKLGGPIRLCGWSFNNGVGPTDTPVTGTANAPAAGATIASVSLGNGTYQIEWSIELTGTPGAADVDNVQLTIGATQIAVSVNLGAVGDYQQEEAEGTVVSGPLTLAAKAIGAATAGSVYKVNMTVIPLTQSTGVIKDGSQNVGFISLPAGGNQTVWLSDLGVAILTEISVQTGLGTISGVIYYKMVYDLIDEAGTPDY